MYKNDVEELLAEKCSDDLMEHGKRAETMAELAHQQKIGFHPAYANLENAAVNGIHTIDPYAHLREKTQMERTPEGWGKLLG
jgi:bifunctional N-acetylglucosamine-1-phosphate-uridyltransferase/glucosamine-1-phosphate-acetyltransferase GlmU-like protein